MLRPRNHAWTQSHHLMKALLEAMLLYKHQLLYDTYIYIYIYIYVCVCVCVYVCVCACLCKSPKTLIMMWIKTSSSSSSSCRACLHGYPWPSLATFPYRSSPLAGLLDYIPYPHIVNECMFVLVVQLLHGHVWGSIRVNHLCFRPFKT